MTNNKQAGALGVFMTVAFWFLVWLLGPGWLTVTYLALTLGILGLISKIDGVSFGRIVGNNNWVFCSVLGMTVISAAMAHFNPLVPEPFGAPVINWVRNLFGYESMKYRDSVFWGVVNRSFFGESFTYGWRDVAFVSYAVATIPAFFISYWDVVKKHKKEIAIVAGTLLVANTLSKRKK